MGGIRRFRRGLTHKLPTTQPEPESLGTIRRISRAGDRDEYLPMATTPIWRYLHGYKFDGPQGLLKTEALYFRRADLLLGDDPREGSYPVPDQGRFGSEMFLRRWCYVNCWQLGNVESEWMWNKYTAWPDENAVAVVSRFDKLAALLMQKGIKVAPVHYIDYEKEGLRPTEPLQVLVGKEYQPFFHKHREFAGEREIRAAAIWMPDVLGRLPDGPRFTLVPVDLDVLIDRIVIPPGAATRVAEWAMRSLHSVGLHKDVQPSAVKSMPAKVLGIKPIATWEIERGRQR